MSDVFISYSRLDRDFVGQLREALNREKQDVWIDWESIPPSQTWWNEIKKGIAKANNFVVVLSPNSMSSPICQMEIEYARELKKRIIPVFHANYDREQCLVDITRRLANREQSATRDIWENRQPYDLFDANEAELKHINYFFFKADSDFQSRFADLLAVIQTDYAHKEQHTTLELRALEWDRRGRDASFLLLDTELEQAQNWLVISEGKQPEATSLHRAYISTSLVQTRRLRNIRRASVIGSLIAGIAIIFAIGASLIGVQANNDADAAELREANANTQVADANAQALIAIATVTQAAIEQEIVSSFTSAMIQYTDNPMQQLAILNQLVDRYPDQAIAYQSRGILYSEIGDFEKAILDFDYMISRSPTYAYTYNLRGVAYYNMSNYEQAIKDYNQAILLNLQDAEIFSNRGLAYLKLDNYDAALNDFDQAISLNLNNAEAFYNRGIVYFHLGNYQTAIDNYDQALRIIPSYAEVYYGRGLVYRLLGSFDQAIIDYDKAIDLKPNDPITYNERGLAYYELAEYEQAIQDFDQALRFDPIYADAFNNRGLAYKELGQNDKAIENYNLAIKIDSKHASSYVNRGHVYNELGEYEKAFADYDQAIKLDPEYTDAYNARGTANIKIGQFESAIPDLNKVITLDPNNILAYYMRGIALHNTSQSNAAIADLTKAIDLGYPNAYLVRALAYNNIENYEAVIQDLVQYELLVSPLDASFERLRQEAENNLNTPK